MYIKLSLYKITHMEMKMNIQQLVHLSQMELLFPSLPILVSFLLPIVFIFLKLTKKNSTRKLPPGPWKWPLIGNMHNLIGLPPHRALHQLALKFGPIMHLQLGELSAIIFSSPEAAKQVMKTHDINFASRPLLAVTENISYASGSIAFGEYGDYWRQLRKICTLELLSTKRVQSFRSLREKIMLDVMRSLATKEGSPVNLTETIYSSTYILVSRATLGHITKGKEALLPIIKEGMELAAGFDIADLYPSIKLLLKMTGLRKRVKTLHQQTYKILDEIIEEHKVANAKINDEKQEDLVDVLLKYQDKGLEIPLTTDNVKAVIMDMVGPGSETSATTVDWTMAELMRNPGVMNKAQDEVRQVYDDKGYVDESSIEQLKYLKAVIKEILRFHPPAPLLLPRKCREKCEINGYEIPVNTKIIVNGWAINRDPKYWENPNCFEPERFLDSTIDYKGNHFEYTPFGSGRRICPGMSFGLANVELPLAMFLYHFDWKLADGMEVEEMDMSDGFGVTARRNQDLLVVPLLKRPLPGAK